MAEGPEDWDVSLEKAIELAKMDLWGAHKARRINGTRLDVESRHLFAEVGRGYAQLAAVMQAERDYEQREIQRIAEAARDDG